MKYKKTKTNRTVPKRKKKHFGTVLLLSGGYEKIRRAFFVPAAVILSACLVFGNRKLEENRSENHYFIVRESSAGIERIPMEDYIVGALAASIPETCEKEACKAQAVILRTNIEWMGMEKGRKEIGEKELKLESLSDWQMRKKWGNDYEMIYEKLENAVKETSQITITYEGVFINAPYFSVSAGKTRIMDEITERGSCPYLTQVDCQADITAPDYLQETVVGQKKFNQKIKELFDGEEQNGQDHTRQNEYTAKDLLLSRDSADYVVTAALGGKEISGEALRQTFGLPSSCFTLQQEKDKVIIVTKGVGHGIGMSQFTANEMALQGNGYLEILQYFFHDCEIKKN